MSDLPAEPGPAQYPPPQDGRPSYGPSAPGEVQLAPPPRSRRLLLAGIGLVVVAAAAVVALALLDPTLFGGGTVLDGGAVERDVAGQFQQREGIAVTVSCPEEMAVVAGGSYRCTGTTAAGEHVPIRIVVTDAARAAYSWTLR